MILFPDAEAIICEYLSDVLTEQVVTQIPNPRPETFVQVLRVGGPLRNLVTDEATVTISSFGRLQQEAHDLSQRVRGWLHDLPYESLPNPVYRITEFTGPANLPDPLSDQARYSQTFSVAVRGYVSTGS